MYKRQEWWCARELGRRRTSRSRPWPRISVLISWGFPRVFPRRAKTAAQAGFGRPLGPPCGQREGQLRPRTRPAAAQPSGSNGVQVSGGCEPAGSITSGGKAWAANDLPEPRPGQRWCTRLRTAPDGPMRGRYARRRAMALGCLLNRIDRHCRKRQGWRVAVCYGLGEVEQVTREYFGA